MDKETENKLIKDRLFYYLEKANLNPNQFAQISEVSQSSLNSIINRPSVPNITTLRKICDGLQISVIEFLDFEPYNRVEKNNEDINETELEKKINEMNSEIDELKKIISKLEKTG
ncbi:helix-turn-helix domain-containing protein [Enterococcus avium]|uniref:helix-turn-helix transcriptional regulator n=1 Tax=Enterococcus avium TaxID=33945 RepID=UPI0035CB57EE